MGLGFYRGRHSKFNAKPKRCRQGVMHHSSMEAARCDELHLMALAQPPLISELRAHPQERFDLTVNGVHVCNYMADFVYRDEETGNTVCEDVKGFKTSEYRIKERLMLAVHGIEISEVRRVRGRR